MLCDKYLLLIYSFTPSVILKRLINCDFVLLVRFIKRITCFTIASDSEAILILLITRDCFVAPFTAMTLVCVHIINESIYYSATKPDGEPLKTVEYIFHLNLKPLIL